MTTPSWADSPIHEQIREAGLDKCEIEAERPLDAATCSAYYQELAENLQEWGRHYIGKPVSLSLFRASSELGLIAQGQTPNKTCVWSCGDPDWNLWNTCKNEWQLTEGTPQENGMNYCPICGGVLIQHNSQAHPPQVG